LTWKSVEAYKSGPKLQIKVPFESFHDQSFFFWLQALAAKKLFVVDYHDTYITYINRINAQPGVAFYASRTLLFLTSDGTLQALAIELTLPPSAPGGAKNSRVFLPPDQDSTKNWVWELAKTHVMTNDSAFHQVVSHL
jgi:hypothetical protein